MLPSDAPLTPNGDTARGWVTEELSRAEYGHELSPLTRAIRWLLQVLSDALGGGVGRPPVAAVLLGLFLVLLVVLVVVVIRNPVRLAHRATSAAVFDGEVHSLADARAASARAAGDGDWDMALVWAFRVLVLVLAESGVLRDAPGLTAHEAVSQAAPHFPGAVDALMGAADLFDAVRYGTAHATAADHARVTALTASLGSPDTPGTPAGPGAQEPRDAVTAPAGPVGTHR